jgi:type II secretory pathway pseudopilin PulG
MRKWRSGRGTTLIETMVALGVLSVGALGTAAVFTQGMERTKSSPADLVATQKAQEGIESVFAARDSRTVTWAQLRNVSGAASDGGIFLDGAQPIKDAGADGIVNTADDGAIETIVYPGRDLTLGTADDKTVTLSDFTREIQIRNLTADLRSITVLVSYQSGSGLRVFTLIAYISDRA